MIIVTGSAGFIGSVLAWNLRSRSKLLLVDYFGREDKKNNLYKIDNTEYMDRDEFIEKIKNRTFKNNVSYVIHIGACSRTTEFDLDYLMSINFDYSRVLCEWCMENDIPFIYASSGAVYGNGESGFSDDDNFIENFKPLNPYGYSKWKFDEWVIKNKFTGNVVGLRFFNVFGPNEYHKDTMSSVIYRAFPLAREKGLIKLFRSYKDGFKDGEQKRDFIYVKDLVSVIEFFMDNKNKKGIYNLGTGTARTFKDLAAALFKALDKELNIEYIDMPPEIRDKYQYFTQADMTKLRNAGYNLPFPALEESINDYVNNYLIRENPYYRL